MTALRDLEQFVKLAKDEQDAWLDVWADVESLRDQARKKNP